MTATPSPPPAAAPAPGRPAPGSLRAWILACRPQTLTVGLVPVLVGAAAAHRVATPRIGAILAALFGAIWIQIGTNLANDVFDYEKGADNEHRLGPLRVTQAGLLSPSAVRRGMVICFALAVLCGLYLTWVSGPILIAIGVLSIASGIAYTGGPYPLGYNGLGDLFVFLFFGFVAVLGTMFVGAGQISSLAAWAAIPVGALATAVLVVNNVRDHTTDVHAGKRTLVVRFGRRFGVAEYALLLASAYAVPVAMVLLQHGGPLTLLPLLTLPIAVPLVRTVATQHQGPILNRTLARTAMLLLLHGVLFAIGIWFGSPAGPS